MRSARSIAIGELERSLLRSCVAAEEDARIRCGAARRYATRVVAAAQEQAAARLEAPARERDAITREIDAIAARRQQAAAALEALIAGLEHAAEANHGFGAADEKTDSSVLSRARTGGTITAPADSEFTELTASGRAPGPAPAARTLPPEIDLSSAGLNQATAVESVEPDDEQPQWGDADLSPAGIDMGASDRGGASIIDRATVTRPEHARPRRPARVRVPIAAGSAAALLLVLQGSTGAPRVSGPPAAIAAASFAPAAVRPFTRTDTGFSHWRDRHRPRQCRAGPHACRRCPHDAHQAAQKVLGARGRRRSNGCPGAPAHGGHRAPGAALDRIARRRRRRIVSGGERSRAAAAGPGWTGRRATVHGGPGREVARDRPPLPILNRRQARCPDRYNRADRAMHTLETAFAPFPPRHHRHRSALRVRPSAASRSSTPTGRPAGACLGRSNASCWIASAPSSATRIRSRAPRAR